MADFSEMTPQARQRKWATLTHLPLPATLHLLQTQDGLVQPLELPPSLLPRVTSVVDRQALEHQVSSRFSLVLEHQDNTPDLRQHLVGSPLVLGYLDSILHQELQGSSLPAPEPLASSQGIIHLKELQGSYLEALFLTQPDHFLLALEHPLGRIQTCLSQVVSQEEEMACMDQAVQVDSPLQLALALSLHSLLEAFPQYPLGHGDHLQVEASLLLLAPLVLALALWAHMVDLLLQVACHFMVPYDLPLHAGIMPQLLITIVGEPLPGADRFNVDFIKGQDVVFHFNPRFHEQTIVRNTKCAECWGPEEREGGFPFVPGQRFELKILVEEDMFKVAVDGTHLLEYEHRVGGLEDVTLLRICGDITLYSAAPSMI
ncbi:hypothetical protein INR49_013101 [Caranx melampygus]|nr:hypothetical protein INR49_013101 [Caranx melampygus]